MQPHPGLPTWGSMPTDPRLRASAAASEGGSADALGPHPCADQPEQQQALATHGSMALQQQHVHNPMGLVPLEQYPGSTSCQQGANVMSCMAPLPPSSDWSKLQQRVSELRVAVTHWDAVAADLKQQVTGLTASLQEKHAENSFLHSHCAQVTQDLQLLLARVQGQGHMVQDQLVGSLRADLASCQQQVVALEAQRQALQFQLAECGAQEGAALGAEREERERMAGELGALRLLLAARQRHLDALQEQAGQQQAAHTQHVEQLTQQLQEATQQLQQLRQDASQKIQASDARAAESEAAAAQVSQQLQEAQTMVSQQAEQLHAYHQQLAELQVNREWLEAAVADLQDGSASGATNLLQLHEALRESRAAEAAWRTRAETAEAALQQQQQERQWQDMLPADGTGSVPAAGTPSCREQSHAVDQQVAGRDSEDLLAQAQEWRARAEQAEALLQQLQQQQQQLQQHEQVQPVVHPAAAGAQCWADVLNSGSDDEEHDGGRNSSNCHPTLSMPSVATGDAAVHATMQPGSSTQLDPSAGQGMGQQHGLAARAVTDVCCQTEDLPVAAEAAALPASPGAELAAGRRLLLAAQEELACLRASNSQLRDQLAAARSGMVSVEDVSRALQDARRLSAAKLEQALAASAAVWTTRLREATEAAAAADARASEAADELAELQASYSTLQSDLQAARAEAAVLRKQLGEVEEDHQQQLKQLRLECESEAAGALLDATSASQAQQAAAAQQVHNLRQQLQAAEAKVSELQQQVSGLQYAATRQVEQLQEQVSELAAVSAGDYVATISELEAARGRISELQQQVSELQAAAAMAGALQQQLADAQVAQASMEAVLQQVVELQQARAQSDTLRQQLLQLQLQQGPHAKQLELLLVPAPVPHSAPDLVKAEGIHLEDAAAAAGAAAALAASNMPASAQDVGVQAGPGLLAVADAGCQAGAGQLTVRDVGNQAGAGMLALAQASCQVGAGLLEAVSVGSQAVTLVSSCSTQTPVDTLAGASVCETSTQTTVSALSHTPTQNITISGQSQEWLQGSGTSAHGGSAMAERLAGHALEAPPVQHDVTARHAAPQQVLHPVPQLPQQQLQQPQLAANAARLQQLKQLRASLCASMQSLSSQLPVAVPAAEVNIAPHPQLQHTPQQVQQQQPEQDQHLQPDHAHLNQQAQQPLLQQGWQPMDSKSSGVQVGNRTPRGQALEPAAHPVHTSSPTAPEPAPPVVSDSPSLPPTASQVSPLSQPGSSHLHQHSQQSPASAGARQPGAEQLESRHDWRLPAAEAGDDPAGHDSMRGNGNLRLPDAHGLRGAARDHRHAHAPALHSSLTHKWFKVAMAGASSGEEQQQQQQLHGRRHRRSTSDISSGWQAPASQQLPQQMHAGLPWDEAGLAPCQDSSSVLLALPGQHSYGFSAASQQEAAHTHRHQQQQQHGLELQPKPQLAHHPGSSAAAAAPAAAASSRGTYGGPGSQELAEVALGTLADSLVAGHASFEGQESYLTEQCTTHDLLMRSLATDLTGTLAAQHSRHSTLGLRASLGSLADDMHDTLRLSRRHRERSRAQEAAAQQLLQGSQLGPSHLHLPPTLPQPNHQQGQGQQRGTALLVLPSQALTQLHATQPQRQPLQAVENWAQGAQQQQQQRRLAGAKPRSRAHAQLLDVLAGVADIIRGPAAGMAGLHPEAGSHRSQARVMPGGGLAGAGGQQAALQSDLQPAHQHRPPRELQSHSQHPTAGPPELGSGHYHQAGCSTWGCPGDEGQAQGQGSVTVSLGSLRLSATDTPVVANTRYRKDLH